MSDPFDEMLHRGLRGRADTLSAVSGDLELVARTARRRTARRVGAGLGTGALGVAGVVGLMALRSPAGESQSLTPAAAPPAAAASTCADGQVATADGDVLLHDGQPYQVGAGQCLDAVPAPMPVGGFTVACGAVGEGPVIVGTAGPMTDAGAPAGDVPPPVVQTTVAGPDVAMPMPAPGCSMGAEAGVSCVIVGSEGDTPVTLTGEDCPPPPMGEGCLVFVDPAAPGAGQEPTTTSAEVVTAGGEAGCVVSASADMPAPLPSTTTIAP